MAIGDGSGGSRPRLDFRERLQTALAGAYVVDDEISSGGASRVFRARESALGRHVVIKVLSPEAAEEVDSERFLREIHLAANLQHAHIVPLLSAGEAGVALYYTMPYVEGETLRSRLDRDATDPLRIPEIIRILRDVAEALDYSHARGVIHRDIKPENVLISGGHALVTDFGIAKAITVSAHGTGTTVTATGIGLGTPAYVAPEQAIGEGETDSRADLYSLGCVAYEMLAGHRPFQATSAAELIAAHLLQTPAALPAGPDVPPGLTAIVMQCLEKDRDRRPPSAAEFIRMLDLAASTQRVYDVPDRHATRQRWPARAAAIIGATALLAFLVWQMRGRARGIVRAAPAAPAVAILPFQSFGRDTANEYFSDGMTEELVGTLARMHALRIPSRAAIFGYKGKQIDPREVGAQLHVQAVVTGSVRRAGNRVRVTVQLVQADDGHPLWTEEYDRTLRDVFAIQDDIARAIAAKLKITLVGRAATGAEGYSTNPEANDWYLRGLHVRGSPGGDLQQTAGKSADPREIARAIDYFERATTLDSTFAIAYAALAESYVALGDHLDPKVALPRAREAAMRAVSLDPALTEAGVALADIRFAFDWDWPAAEREYQRVLSLDPLSTTALASYENFLLASRRYNEAAAILQRLNAVERREATDTSALTATAERRVAWVEGLAGHVDQAEQHFRTSLSRAPRLWVTHWQYGLILASLGRGKEAVREMEIVRGQVGDVLPYRTHLGAAYAVAGAPDTARRIIRELEALSHQEYVPKDHFTVLYYCLGDTATALRWLKRAIDDHHYWLPFDYGGNPFFVGLRSNPEFIRLMRRIGAPMDSSSAPSG